MRRARTSWIGSAMVALAMAVCSPQVSATQFAIYMSISNFGGSLGSAAYGLVADKTSFVQDFALVGAMFLVTLIAVSFYRSREYGEPAATRPRQPPLVS